MAELGQLEKAHQEFDKRQARVIVASLDDQETSAATQADFPHLLVLSDKDRGLVNAVQVIHEKSSPDGGDSAAPTTIIVDGDGTVRWTFRPDRFLRRLSPAEVVAALDGQLAGG
jgi:peroxiredoxin